MTKMTTSARKKGSPTWGVARAKARLSEIIDRAIAEGPQTITRNGKNAVVVVSADEWRRKTQRKGTLVDFFMNSPLRGSGIKIERIRGGLRKVDL